MKPGARSSAEGEKRAGTRGLLEEGCLLEEERAVQRFSGQPEGLAAGTEDVPATSFSPGPGSSCGAGHTCQRVSLLRPGDEGGGRSMRTEGNAENDRVR